MKKYDVVIVGASTAGSYFARRMAEKGFSVLLIEKYKRENLSPAYDIFHMGKDDMELFGLPKVKEGDGIYAFEFSESAICSVFGNHPKPSSLAVVGMHKHKYCVLMNDWAVEAGADIIYEATFKGLVYNECGKINGVTYEKDGVEETVFCRLVADCSGIPAVVRRSLPDDYGIEKFALTPKDIFYVTLRYIDFEEKRSSRYLRSDFWLYFKSWLAPSEGSDALIGMGACGGFEQVEKVYKLFEKTVRLPAHKVTRIEKGMTPYHRAPYSFVSDGFVAMGDAACITKPNCGEGCTASLVLEDIAVDVASAVMADGGYPTKEKLWSINKRYNNTQGKEFASLMALLGSIIRHSAKANEFLFKNDVVFSRKLLGGMGNGIELSVGDYAKTLIYIIIGLVTGNIRPAELKAVIDAIVTSGKLTAHYEKYPETPEGYEAWAKEAEILWAKTGKVAEWDSVDNF
ncbi:MAG: NAD(P)/FAD-dependent oxidoreductase [Clostridia bacterium]|nr:NAD(P)/FAD-dependent oxidoreductase [Clostridia bacterium]